MSSVAIEDLRFSQQVVLWASRLWVLTQAMPRCRDELVLDGFIRLGIPTAACALTELLSALTQSGHYQPIFLRPCQHCLSEDEHGYLEILQALQQGQNGMATERLGNWCPPDCLRRALTAGKRMTQQLSGAGLQLGPVAPALIATTQVSSRWLH